MPSDSQKELIFRHFNISSLSKQFLEAELLFTKELYFPILTNGELYFLSWSRHCLPVHYIDLRPANDLQAARSNMVPPTSRHKFKDRLQLLPWWQNMAGCGQDNNANLEGRDEPPVSRDGITDISEMIINCILMSGRRVQGIAMSYW